MKPTASTLPLTELHSLFGNRLQENVQIANYTSARVGGVADALLMVRSADELARAATLLWERKIPFILLGSGANVIVSDAGIRGVVLLNRAHTVRIDAESNPPTVWAESGANFGTVARQTALRGLSGLEWAATIPGTVGGAVYGNAGAHGSDVQTNLLLADILHRTAGRQLWTNAQMAFEYRSSGLKRSHEPSVILAAQFRLEPSTPEQVKAKMEQFSAQRKRTQPPGASTGSVFKNPPGDFAGRLIEAAGLKGTRVGGVEVSRIHANFFVNDRDATASDYYNLIQIVRSRVEQQFGIRLELEVELIGDWNGNRSTGDMAQ
jgi:UDP-N-acetylmuramate dehydrogenase